MGAAGAALVRSFNIRSSQLSSAFEVARAMVRTPSRNGSSILVRGRIDRVVARTGIAD
ncbi:hypothetical protein [Streptomyces sp. NBC_01766]|uniref:hypothetical protein n=1 Tax=Streptomyces sp. NBC_01766 TaxID=2975936 RepID=UPI003FA346AC